MSVKDGLRHNNEGLILILNLMYPKLVFNIPTKFKFKQPLIIKKKK